MIGIKLSGLTNLKILDPIIKEIGKENKYILFIPKNPKGAEYYKATRENIKLSSPHVIDRAFKVVDYIDEGNFVSKVVNNRIEKIVGIGLSFGVNELQFLKDKSVARFNILYWTDTLKGRNKRDVITSNRVYYPTKYIKDFMFKDVGIKENKGRDRLLGYPPFDDLFELNGKKRDGVLLLPLNVKTINEVKIAFSVSDPMVKISKKISMDHNLYIKMRFGNKLVFPKKIRSYCVEHIMEAIEQFPSTIVKALSKTYSSVMFNSNGIYECVIAGNYVFNIPIPLIYDGFDKKSMKRLYDVGGIYGFDGVSESIDQEKFVSSGYNFRAKEIDQTQREKWLEKFVGNIDNNGARNIAKDILEF